MANERDKDLPLIVSEILIELHEVRTDIQEMRGDIKSMQGDIKEMRADIGQLTHAMNAHTEGVRDLTASIIELVQTNHRVLGRRLDDHDTRIERLETGQ
jgi:septal ring factor EnvC (AmiA/AmiB activator)